MSTGNRVVMRLARRSILKARMRSLLIVALIAVTVSVGTGVAVTLRSSTPTSADRLQATFGDADTLITFNEGLIRPVVDADRPILVDGVYVEPSSVEYSELVEQRRKQVAAGRAWVAEFDPRQMQVALDASLNGQALVSRVVTTRDSGGPFYTSSGLRQVTDVDVAQPLAAGLFELTDGRFPRTSTEIAVTPGGAGPRDPHEIGDIVTHSGVAFEVVGVISPRETRYEQVAVATHTGVDRLNVDRNGIRVEVRIDTDHQAGDNALELALKTLDFPVEPSITGRDEYWTPPTRGSRWAPAAVSTILGIQMALVAATAFAVGVRRRTREFGQLVAAGMESRQIRRMVLFEAALLGTAGAVVGVLVAAIGVSTAIRFGWLTSIGDRPASSLQWSMFDVFVPASIGVLAAVSAAWWPTRTLVGRKSPVPLAGNAPRRLRPSMTRWGIVGVAGGIACVAALSTSASADQASPRFVIAFITAVSTSFAGALLLVGPMLASIGRHCARLPLIVRLVARNSDRHRSRSWAVVGAFIATLALPVLAGSAITAYPNSFVSPSAGQLDRRIITVAQSGQSYQPGAAAADKSSPDAQATALRAELTEAITATVRPVKSFSVSYVRNGGVVVDRPSGRSTTSVNVAVINPDLIDLVGVSPALAQQVTGSTALWVGSAQLPIGGSTLLEAQSDGYSTPQIPVSLRRGPAAIGSGVSVLVSPELAARLSPGGLFDATVHLFAEPLSDAQETSVFTAMNMAWTNRFGEYQAQSVDTPPTSESQLQEAVLRRTRVNLQQSPTGGSTERRTRLASLLAASGVATIIALITASLAAVELDAHLQSMIATGAAPRIRRTFLGAQTLFHLILAATLAIPLALLIFYATTRGDPNRAPGLIVPWRSIVASGIIIPMVVAAVVALIFRNGRPAVSRRIS